MTNQLAGRCVIRSSAFHFVSLETILWPGGSTIHELDAHARVGDIAMSPQLARRARVISETDYWESDHDGISFCTQVMLRY
jgi:hypothetical protein